MRGAKIFGIRITLAACVLSLLLAGGAGFISVAWAGKPDHARRTRTEYGYAMFRDDTTDAIRSDGRDSNSDSIVDPYVDCNIGGEDLVQIVLYDDDNTLKYVEVYFGKMTYHYPDFDPSGRRVWFEFDISHDTTMLEGYDGHEAVYDILVSETPSGTRRGNQANNGYYLNDDSIHFPIKVYADGSVDWVQFVVDRGYQGSEDDGAITQKTVDAFYGDDENIDYWDTSTYEPEPGQIIYSLDYVNGFDVTRVDRDEDGELDTWIFATGLPPVNLFVEEYIYSSKGKSGKERTVGKETVYLAEYSELPFEIAVSLDPLAEYPVQSSQAPRRHNTLSTLWGKIKVR